MTRLMDDLLDALRITRGKVVLQLERVSLGLVLTNAVKASRPAVEAAAHDLTLVLPGEAPHINGDVVRLSQVFTTC